MKKELKRLNKVPKIITLDLTKCKSGWDYHERIRIAFDFPKWYGKNWDAFWDLLRTDCDADKVEIRGEHSLRREFYDHGYVKMTHEILNEMVADCARRGELFEYEVID